MGAVMVAVIMAGRTGAAYAAQLGTMQVNEEIDALQTLGISPMEFLVLPRMLALIVMMPMLCLYADLMGIIGGLIVGVGMLDQSVHRALSCPGIRCTDRTVGMPAGHAMRSQRIGRRPRHDIGGGNCHHQHCGGNGHHNGDLQCFRNLRSRVPRSGFCARKQLHQIIAIYRKPLNFEPGNPNS